MTKPGKETPVFILQSRKELFIPKVSHLRVTLWGSQVSLTLLSVWVNRYTVHRFCFCRLGEHCNASKASLHRTQVWNPQIKWKITLITAASSAPMHHARQDGWRCSCSLLGKGLNSFFFPYSKWCTYHNGLSLREPCTGQWHPLKQNKNTSISFDNTLLTQHNISRARMLIWQHLFTYRLPLAKDQIHVIHEMNYLASTLRWIPPQLQSDAETFQLVS